MSWASVQALLLDVWARSAGRASSTGGVGPGVLVGGGIHAWLRPARPGPGADTSCRAGTPSLRPHPRAATVRTGTGRTRAGRCSGWTGSSWRRVGPVAIRGAWDTIWGPRTGCAVSEVPGTCPGSRQSRRSTPPAAQACRDPGVRASGGCRPDAGNRGPRPDHGPSQVTGPGSARRPRHGRWATTHTSSRRASFQALLLDVWVTWAEVRDPAWLVRFGWLGCKVDRKCRFSATGRRRYSGVKPAGPGRARPILPVELHHTGPHHRVPQVTGSGSVLRPTRADRRPPTPRPASAISGGSPLILPLLSRYFGRRRGILRGDPFKWLGSVDRREPLQPPLHGLRPRRARPGVPGSAKPRPQPAVPATPGRPAALRPFCPPARSAQADPPVMRSGC